MTEDRNPKNEGTVPQQAEAGGRLGDGYHTMKYFNSHNEIIQEYLILARNNHYINDNKSRLVCCKSVLVLSSLNTYRLGD